MGVVTIHSALPLLHRPVLLAAFNGWNDAGECATGAISTLSEQLGAAEFADIDAEEFFDFQSTRPITRLDDHGRRTIEWPANTFSWAALPGEDRDMILLAGTEPNLRWRSFTHGIIDLAQQAGVELVITLGALQVDLPHTRAVPVNGATSDPELARELQLSPSRYEGPTGITGVLHQGCASAGVPTASLWAGVPHYLSATAYLAGTLALVERTAALLDIDLTLGDLASRAATQMDEIAALVAQDTDLSEYVEELEQQAPEADLGGPAATGDELAAEFERYLRDRGGS